VCAVDDVRSGSIKRVASAVDEAATAVRLIHQYLAPPNGVHPGEAPTIKANRFSWLIGGHERALARAKRCA
jgi:hypothetical protein